jgi:hypothetical protein
VNVVKVSGLNATGEATKGLKRVRFRPVSGEAQMFCQSDWLDGATYASLACGLPTLKPQHSSSKQIIDAGCLMVPFVLLMLALPLVHLLVALLQDSFAASE